MNIPSSPLKENLILFFNECDKFITNYNLQEYLSYEVEYKFTRQSTVQRILSKGCKPKIQWILVRNSFIEEMENIESINRCVDNCIEYFGLIYNTNKPGFAVTEQFVKNSRNFHKRELVSLFFRYKELQEESGISITDFVTLLIQGVWSESIYFKVTAQLIGFRTNLKKIKVCNFTIRSPTEEELNRIITDHERWSLYNITNPDDIASISFSFLHDTQLWVFMEAQYTRLKKPHTISCLYQQNELYNNDYAKIIFDLKKLILTLRLYNGNYIGIRSLFIHKSFIYESNYLEPWKEYPFLNVDFGKFGNSFNLESKDIFPSDVKEINTLFRKLMLYELNPLKQIDKALEHFFNSFEQNYSVYTFTELIMSLETMFNENIKVDQNKKLDLIRKIREAENENIGLNVLEEYNNRNSIQKSIKMLNQLLYPGKKDKSLNKFFLDYKNNGCYKIRNDLIHGNLSLNSEEIRKKIPDLEEYVRLALLKLIDLRINNKLKSNEDNYFKELKKILNI